MPSRAVSDRVVTRLRALGMVPPGRGAVVSRAGRSRGVPAGTKLVWDLRDAVTGEPLGVGSRFPAKDLAACRAWRFAEGGGMTLVEPDEQGDGDG